MPWTKEDADKHNKGLSEKQKEQWAAVANDALKRCQEKGGKDCEASAIRQANAAVSRSDMAEFSLTIRKAYFDEKTQEMRWKADTSDTETDSYDDNMTLELFSDFLHRIETAEKPPEHFCSDYWSGGTPYISVSHYHDQNGAGVPGTVDAVYVDGNVLKAKGRFSDTPLGRACFKSVCESLHNMTEKPVRVSIAFLDYKHQHKSTGTIFERLSDETRCKECLQEAVAAIIDGEKPQGKRYLAGHLIHFALTRVPVNRRTLMEVDKSMTTQIEDAESIVGEELAKELAEKEKEVGKSEFLVIKAEDGKCPKCGKELDENGKCPECDKEEETEKADIVDPVVDSFAPLHEKLDRMLSLLMQEPEPIPSHPLDSVFAQFKQDFDSVMLADTTIDEKLRSLQDSINAVGGEIVRVVRSEAKPVSEAKAEADKFDQLTGIVEGLAQKIELLSTQVSTRSTVTENTNAPIIPARRGLSVPPQLVAKKVESITPKLHDLIQKSVQ